VRVLGVFALIDQGELDWKIVCLNEKESQEKQVKTIYKEEMNSQRE